MRDQRILRFVTARIASLLILALVSWSLSSHAFLHTHTAASGRLVAHSHLSPLQSQESSRGSDHTHSPLEYLFHHLYTPDYHLNYAPALPAIILAVVAPLFLAPRMMFLRGGDETSDQIRAPPFVRLHSSF